MSLATPAVVREPQIAVIARPAFVEPAHLPVQWIGEFTDGERLSEFAGRLCSMSQANPAHRSTREYLENVVEQRSSGVLEHAHYSLLVEGVSNALTRELLRHREGLAYSLLSQRFVDEQATCFVMPPAIIGDEMLEGAWMTQISSALATYISLVEQLLGRFSWVDDKVERRNLARDGARGVLPNSIETKIVVTGSIQAFRLLFEEHGHEGAEFEIRRLAVLMLRVLQMEAPALFSDFKIHVAADRRDAAQLLRHRR